MAKKTTANTTVETLTHNYGHREAGEAPSIGIILCKEKRRTIVEYALHDARKPIGVATYRMVKLLPKELKGQLPSPTEIAKLLEGVE